MVALPIDVQRGTAAIGTGGGTSAPSTNFGSLTAAFVRNSNNRRMNGGRDDENTGNLEVDDMSGTVELTATNTITYTREGGSLASNMRFAWESWEYTGAGGGADEFIVRSRDTVTLTGETNTATLTNTPNSIDNCIPFITGIRVNSGADDADSGTAIAWLSGADTLNVKRGSGANNTVIVQVVTVEFTGSNWQVAHGRQEGNGTDSFSITLRDAANGTTVGGGDILDWSNAAIFHQQVANNLNGIDDSIADTSAAFTPGSLTTTVDVTFDAQHVDSATAGNREEGFVHVLQHDGMLVTRIPDGQSLTGAMNVDVASAGLAALITSSVEASHTSSGTGTAYGRGWVNTRLTSITNVEKWVHRSGNTINTEIQLIDFDPPVVFVTDFNTTEQFDWGNTNLVITGTGFGAAQGTGMVEFWSDTIGTIKTTQTIDSWADTSIQIDTVQGSLPNNATVYLVVTTDPGDENNAFAVVVGLPPYNEALRALNPDHYWRFNNTLIDTGVTGPTRNMITEVGATTYTTANIADGNSHALILNEITERIGPADSPNMNVTINAQRRTLGCWVQTGSIQHPLGCIYKEGAQIQNLAFLLGYGGIVLAQMADTPGNPGNIQAWSDIKLTIGRPYHILMRYSFPNNFELFLDGVVQTETDGNPLGAGTFDSHSGDIVIGAPDTTLETGGTDITYSGIEDLFLSDFTSWSENSTHADDGAVSNINIRDTLFRRGAIPDDIIVTGTESAMQTALDATADARPDWPLSYRIDRVTGNGNLELLFTDKLFDSRITDHLEWRGVSGETLTIVRQGTTNLDAAKTWTATSGTITVVTQPDVTITVRRASDLTTVTDIVRILMTAAAGGDLPFEDSVAITRSGSVATVTHTAHGLRTGLRVVIRRADQPEYNGVKTITVTGPNAYTYAVSGSPTTPATGTINATSAIISGVTSSGSITVQDHRYTTDQPVTIIARRGASPRYKSATSSSTIVSTGLDANIFLIPDE